MVGAAMALGAAISLPGCATVPAARAAGRPRLPLLRLGADQIIDVRPCIRPFRPRGPRLDAEQAGDTLIIHNYGHGGSGWSLSWGSAEIAVARALSVVPQRVAVIGCGIIGLSTAVAAQRSGLSVTIYARELLPRTRSVRANGSWTPDSRIALAAAAGPAFGVLWEQMARMSWKTFRSYLGLAGNPVEFIDQYRLSDTPFADGHQPVDPARGTYETGGMPQQNGEFGHYQDRIRDINPPAETLAGADNPFPTAQARRASSLIFNFASYGQLLLSQFFEAGGRFVMRSFSDPSEITALPEKVVINCTGYAARQLWADQSIIPVRGQTGWLVPQPGIHYGFYYRYVSVLSKADGVMVQNLGHGEGDMLGVGDSNEQPDRADIEEALQRVRRPGLALA
jgi:hypothetical protein